MQFTEENDDILVKQCIDGKKDAQRKLYLKYADKMMAVCFRYTNNREESEDILQEGFIKVFSKLNQYKMGSNLGGWIRTIMVNTAIQAYREKARMYETVNIDKVRINQHSPDDTSCYMGAMELLKMVQNLPPAYRMVFNLFVFEGLNHDEIAAKLGISNGTSKSNLFQARRILQENIKINTDTTRKLVGE